jgi:hypothetical protein
VIGPDDDTKPSARVERRLSEHIRQYWQPHPDAVAEAAKVLEFYGGDPGPLGDDAVRRVVVAVLSWHERQAAVESLQARRREDPMRLAESIELADRVSAHVRGNGR